MLWFFDREEESLRLETRYDNDRAEFVATVTTLTAANERNGSSPLKISASGLAGLISSSESSIGLGGRDRSFCLTVGGTSA